MTLSTIGHGQIAASQPDPFTPAVGHLTRQLGGNDQFERMSKWLELFMGTAEVAKVLARTAFVPEPMRGQPEDIAAAMMKGLELGIDPLDALANMYVVKGKIGFSAEFMRRRVLEAGHEIVFDEQTDDRCKVRGRRSGSNEWTVVTFTKAQATTAGVQNLQKFAADMLVARASSRLCRRIFPDVLAGAAIIEDVVDGEIIDMLVDDGAPAQRTLQRAKRQQRKAAAPAPQRPAEAQPGVASDLDEFPGDDEKPATPEPAENADNDESGYGDTDPSDEPPITKPQLQKLSILRQREGYADDDEGREDWFRWVEVNIGRLVGSNKDLTKAECSVLIDVLEPGEDPAK
jgi:hypothetical protein